MDESGERPGPDAPPARAADDAAGPWEADSRERAERDVLVAAAKLLAPLPSGRVAGFGAIRLVRGRAPRRR